MEILFLLIAAIIVLVATVVAIVALCRGESPAKTFKTWIARVVDAICGAG